MRVVKGILLDPKKDPFKCQCDRWDQHLQRTPLVNLSFITHKKQTLIYPQSSTHPPYITKHGFSINDYISRILISSRTGTSSHDKQVVRKANREEFNNGNSGKITLSDNQPRPYKDQKAWQRILKQETDSEPPDPKLSTQPRDSESGCTWFPTLPLVDCHFKPTTRNHERTLPPSHHTRRHSTHHINKLRPLSQTHNQTSNRFCITDSQYNPIWQHTRR
jgi:hypothetical protein